MRFANGQLRFSATDLAHHLSCEHLTELERQYAEGRRERDHYHDPVLELLKELGDRHENAYLTSLKEQGHSVVEVEKFAGQKSIDQTLEAMRKGVDVIAQANLVNASWGGWADFLLKVDQPSEFGSWSYEVADTKLSQTTRAGTVLQLCLYTDILRQIQGFEPSRMYVIKPGSPFEIETLQVADYVAYFRMVKRHFETSIEQGPNLASYPQPNPHCQTCDWWRHCQGQWRDDDHLTFVAGLGKSPHLELTSQGISTLEAFATADTSLTKPPKRGAKETYDKLHRQAQIQHEGRQAGEPRHAFNEVEEQRGFLRLPEPSPGDVFFDIEGYPRAIGEGLEYLFGYVTQDGENPEYHHRWGLNKRDERTSFIQFMDFVSQRWQTYPDMHVYHFAPYEPAALKRLATKHATHEEELDKLLRSERLVDLYAITHQAVRASVESYSIKELEKFYGYVREEALKEASQSLRSLERMIELDLLDQLTPEIRSIIERYNQDDCLSTLALRDWLETLRQNLEASGTAIPRPEEPPAEAREEAQQIADETREVFEKLIADIDEMPQEEEQASRWMLAHALGYFQREGKCSWWEFFRMHELDFDELLRERKAITGLEFVGNGEATSGRLPVHRYRFPTQEVTLVQGDSLEVVKGHKLGEVISVDHTAGTIDIRKRGDSVNIHPTEIFAFDHVRPGDMPQSLLEFGRELLSSPPRTGRYELLAKRPPRFQRLSLPMKGEMKDVAIQLVADLDHSYLPIQGPPGAGKTFIGSHMIAALASQGKRIGVTAVSHKVIINLLEGVLKNSSESSGVRVGHQPSKSVSELPEGIRVLKNRDQSIAALQEGYVVGGTAWLWSHESLEEQLDYLFIDEAGQMSLAMALAAGRAAKNIVLLGDPQQLEQPQQGTHPEGAGIAALSHILDGKATMPEDRGLFLSHTWRLHPSICEFTSEQYYDFRLASQASLDNQRVHGPSQWTGNGLRFIPVEHDANQNRSQEEVSAIKAVCQTLLDGRHSWIDRDGREHALSLDDLLIIAPYNAQVSALRRELPTGARIGTVDKFQGQEAPIVLYSMTSSSVHDAPRGMEFLFSPNRMNVATSRARCLAILVGSPALFTPACQTPDQIRLANGFCRFLELADTTFLENMA